MGDDPQSQRLAGGIITAGIVMLLAPLVLAGAAGLYWWRYTRRTTGIRGVEERP